MKFFVKKVLPEYQQQWKPIVSVVKKEKKKKQQQQKEKQTNKTK